MGFRINQNIGAMVALNNLQHNDMAMSKSIERLSTGLRIVRAADDPSGLVISERFRAQVEGIGQAIRNSQDGINMVQTAEGALDEVSNILRNMRNVALHAANTGPNDASTLQADQNQIGEAIKTLDRIASTTQFGAKKILDGSAGVQGTVSDSNVNFVSGTTASKAGTYNVTITQEAVKGKVSSHTGGVAAARTTARVATNGTNAALTANETLTISGSNVDQNIEVDLTTGMTTAQIRDAINANSSVQELGITASIDGGGNIQLDQDRLGSGVAGELDISITANGNGQTAYGAGTGTASTGTATASSRIAEDELLSFSNGANQVNVELAAGTTLSAAVSQINKALSNASIGVTADFDTATGEFTLTNNEYGGSTTVKNTFSSNRSGLNSTGLGLAASASYNLASSATSVGAAGTDGEDVAGNFGAGNTATGKGQFLTGDSGTDPDGLVVKFTGNAAGSFGSVTVTNNSLNFQIGAFAGQTAQLAINSLSSSNLGTNATGTTTLAKVDLASIDVTSNNGAGAQDAISVIDAAISQVTELRSQLGSFQKDILESTVSTLGVAKQNLASSESNIRDADFAEEMMKNSRSQILSQTGMSMLTQANQSGQAVMALFR